MTDDIFIKYVNSPLENDPTALHGIYDLISLSVSIPPEYNSETRQMIDLIVKFSEFNNYVEAKQHCIEKMEHTSNRFVLASAFSDVYGYTEDHCPKTCPCLGGGIDKAMAIGSEHFGDKNHLKCYECNQKYVQYVVGEIIDHKDISKIVGLLNFLSIGGQLFRSEYSIEKSKDGQNEIVKEKNIYYPLYQNLSFGLFLGSAVSYSLTEFLIKSDRRKLNRCERCNEVFISNKNDKRIKYCPVCSPKNKWTKEQNAEYHRNWRKVQKEKERKIKFEARIDNLMKRTGYSREEAIEIIEADSMMQTD